MFCPTLQKLATDCYASLYFPLSSGDVANDATDLSPVIAFQHLAANMSTAAAQKAAVAKFRSWVFNIPKVSMLQQQEQTASGSSLKGPFHIEQTVVPAPNEQDLRGHVWGAVSDMRMDGETIEEPLYAPLLGGEWTDSLPAFTSQTPKGDSGSAGVMLYFHGGSYKYSLSPLPKVQQ